MKKATQIITCDNCKKVCNETKDYDILDFCSKKCDIEYTHRDYEKARKELEDHLKQNLIEVEKIWKITKQN